MGPGEEAWSGEGVTITHLSLWGQNVLRITRGRRSKRRRKLMMGLLTRCCKNFKNNPRKYGGAITSFSQDGWGGRLSLLVRG